MDRFLLIFLYKAPRSRAHYWSQYVAALWLGKSHSRMVLSLCALSNEPSWTRPGQIANRQAFCGPVDQAMSRLFAVSFICAAPLHQSLVGLSDGETWIWL
jgi:hypothetical protein